MEETIGLAPTPIRRPVAAPSLADLLNTVRALTEPPLRAAVNELHPDSAAIASYHLGWTDERGAATSAVTGKMIRAGLAVLSAAAVGGASRLAVPGAVAVELMHNFSLLHDDIMDDDAIRRDRPSAWTVFGVGRALLAGDALFALAFTVLAELGVPRGAAAARRLGSAAHRLSRGQAADLGFEDRPWTGPEAVGVNEYLAMTEDKTGALFGCAAAVGATLTGGSAPVVDLLDRIGVHLGVAFQLADDAADLRSDPVSISGVQYSDLRRHKKTFPVISALRAGTAASRELAALLRGDLSTSDSLHQAAALIEGSGGRAQTDSLVGRHLAEARKLIRELPCGGPARADLLTLADCFSGSSGNR